MKLHLTVAGAKTELLAEVGHLDAGAREVAGLARVVARVVVVHRLGSVILLQLDLLAVNRPQTMLLLLFLLGRCKLLHGLGAEVVGLGETMLVHLE